jgi:hypothetical protein
MKLEKAEEFATRRVSALDLKILKNHAVMAQAGLLPCCVCGGPADVLRGQPGSGTAKAYCRLDARIARQKAQRAAMRTDAITRERAEQC